MLQLDVNLLLALAGVAVGVAGLGVSAMALLVTLAGPTTVLVMSAFAAGAMLGSLPAAALALYVLATRRGRGGRCSR